MTTEDKAMRELLESHAITFYHAPELWRKCALPVQLNWQSPIKFSRNNRQRVPTDQIGVYAFMLEPDAVKAPKSAYLLYIGKTCDKRGFRARYLRYLNGRERLARPKIGEMLERWEEHIWFYYAPIDDAALIFQVEKALIDACIPPCNDQYGVLIRRARKRIL